MTRFVNAATSPTPAEWRHTPGQRTRSVSRSLAISIGIAFAMLILAQYLAGYFFLWSFRMDARQTTPLTIARYAYYYSDSPRVARRLLWCSAAGAGLALAMLLVLVVPRRRSLHGDARFATRREITDAGLLTGRGIILGRIGGLGGQFITLPGQQGVSLSAQPRAGKGVGLVIPNLLTWPGSVVCVDIKRENWTLTAGYRARMGQQTILLDFLGTHSWRWDLLGYVGTSLDEQINQLQLYGNMLFPDPPTADPFWAASARSLFLGIGLYLFATPSLPRTIGEILRQGMADDEEGFSAHWRRVIQGRMSGTNPLPEQCVRALSDVIDLAPQTASSIRKTFTSRLELWANPLLDAVTSANDFDLRDLRRRPMSIYLAVRPKDIHRLQPVLSLFFQQAIALQTDELPEHNPDLKHQVLMLLDEFPALGRIPIIAEASGFLPGYNVRTLMVMQTPSQLREVYGEHASRTLLKTLASRVYFAPKDIEEAEELSKELGTTTVKVKTLSRPVHALGDGGTRRGRSVSVSEQKRPLMLPQEVRDMGIRKELIFMEGVRPILAKKIRYYEIPWMRKRILPPPSVPAVELVARPPSRSSDMNQMQSANMRCTDKTRARAHETVAVREATLEDLDRLDELTLDDFDLELAHVQIPTKSPGERMTEHELQQAAESFIAALRQ